MAQVQIRDKRKTIDIMSGDEKLGEIRFNPDDTRTYSRFIELVETLTNGKRDIDGVEFDEDELKLFASNEEESDACNNENEADNENSSPSKRLETLEDFKETAATLAKMKKVTDITTKTWESVCKGLDEIFGADVCDIFTQGSLDPELLMPLIDVVMPFFKEARQEKTKPYLKDA